MASLEGEGRMEKESPDLDFNRLSTMFENLTEAEQEAEQRLAKNIRRLEELFRTSPNSQ